MSDVQNYLIRRTLTALADLDVCIKRQPDGVDGLPRALITYPGSTVRDRSGDVRKIIAAAKQDGIWHAVLRSLPLPESAS